jgi:hypothetical protein
MVTKTVEDIDPVDQFPSTVVPRKRYGCRKTPAGGGFSVTAKARTFTSTMKKYFLLILSLLLLLANVQPGLAAGSGACSYHGGVDCEAGADWDGSAVCQDGWRNSSVLYKDVCSSSDKKVYLTDRKEYDQAIQEIEKTKKAFLSSFDLQNYPEDCSSKGTETYNICMAAYSSSNRQMIHIGVGSSQMQNVASQQESKCKLDASTTQSSCEYKNSSRSLKRSEYANVFEDQKRQYVFVEVKKVSPQTSPTSTPSASVATPTYTCPLNATPIAGQCICSQGYQYHENSGQCISYSESCRLNYGPNSYGDKEYCYCSAGYQFNSEKTACVAKPTIDLLPVNSSPASSPLISSNTSNPVTEDHWFTGQLGKQVTVSNALVNKLSGRILLQPQEHGEAWYLDPVTKKRYYMKDGVAAYQMLRSFGMGIANTDLERLQKGDKTLISKLKGRIVLQVQAHGEAFYIHPITGIAHYLRDGMEAYRLMRELSLGVTNNDIYKIPIGEIAAE